MEIVQKPDIRKANRTLDYGSGFYTTTSFKQAEAWVKRRMDEAIQAKGYVNVYDIPEAFPTTLRQLILKSPTEEWVDFVMRNRTEMGFDHDYDIVYG